MSKKGITVLIALIAATVSLLLYSCEKEQETLQFEQYQNEPIQGSVAAQAAPAAQSKDGNAQYLMGLSYKNGDGVLKDEVTAYAWFKVAAAFGHKKAAIERDKLENKFTRNVGNGVSWTKLHGDMKAEEIMKSLQ